MDLALSQLLSLLGACLGFLLGGLLWRAVLFRSKANRYLALTFWATALLTLNHVLVAGGASNPWLILCNDIMWEYLFPVGLLLYFAESSGHSLATNPRRWWLFLPFLLTLVINVIIDLDMEFGWYQLAWVDNESLVQGYYHLEYIGSIVFSVACLIWSYVIVRRVKSEEAGQWLYDFWIWTTAIVVLWVIGWILEALTGIDIVQLIFAGVTLLFFWVSYRGIFQFELAREQLDIRTLLREQAMASVEPTTETADVQVMTENPHLVKFEKLMLEEHLYREPDLSREVVATRLGISSGYLSQQLSAHSNGNFSEYVNRYRVEEVKRLLVDPAFEPFSLLAIGYEAGFNSKSTFYATFKKHTGLSPSQYRQQAQMAS